MMKLNASYSKKVPAEADYSSQQYHCQIEVELDGGLKPEQIQARIHETFGMVRDAVEAELQTARQMVPAMLPPQMPPPQQYIQQQPLQQQSVQQQYNPQRQKYQQNGYAQQNQNMQQNQQYRNSNATASSKQVNYLLGLAKRAGWTVQQILQRCRIPNIEAISSKECSQLIQELSGAAA